MEPDSQILKLWALFNGYEPSKPVRQPLPTIPLSADNTFIRLYKILFYRLKHNAIPGRSHNYTILGTTREALDSTIQEERCL